MYAKLRSWSGLGLGAMCLLAAHGAADKSAYTWANPTPRELMREFSTDRPDQTESPYTVDAGHFQVELDVCNHTRDHDTAGGADVRAREWSVAPLNLKMGLTNRIDFQLMVDPFVSVREEDRRTGTVTRGSGFGDVTTRMKFNLWGNDGGATACGIMPFVKWPLSASEVRNGHTEGGVILAVAYELPGGWGSAVMTGVDFVRDGSAATEWVNSITFSHDLSARLGGYFEFVAVTSDAPGAAWQGQCDAGFTFACTDNLQFDLGCNFGLTRSAPDFQPFVGVSRRF